MNYDDELKKRRNKIKVLLIKMMMMKETKYNIDEF